MIKLTYTIVIALLVAITILNWKFASNATIQSDPEWGGYYMKHPKEVIE